MGDSIRCAVFVFSVCVLCDSRGYESWLSWVVGGIAGALAWSMIVWESRQNG